MRLFALCCLLLSTLLLTSCASIFARNPPVLFLTSEPTGLRFATDYGQSGRTPANLRPPSSVKTIRMNVATLEGGKQEFVLRKRISYWFVGNVLFGGLIGMLVDGLNDNTRVWPSDGEWHIELTPPG